MTLDEIVTVYIREYRDDASAEMEDYRTEKSRVAAIRRAALCEFRNGKRHPHQYRIPRRGLELAEERLQAAAKELAAARDFDALHEIVKREIGSDHGIGRLVVYDIAHRIGAYLGKAPALVYLHRGTKKGAAILGFCGDALDPKILPAAFRKLTPAEIEDCLCIYKEELRGGRSNCNAGCGVARRPRRCVK
jgi:hypothetical protein